MNRTELASAVAQKTGLTKKDADSAVAALMEVLERELAAGNRVQLLGFGSFEVRERPQRTGKKPGTNEEIVIPASKTPVFKAGKALKDAVNQ